MQDGHSKDREAREVIPGIQHRYTLEILLPSVASSKRNASTVGANEHEAKNRANEDRGQCESELRQHEKAMGGNPSERRGINSTAEKPNL